MTQVTTDIVQTLAQYYRGFSFVFRNSGKYAAHYVADLNLLVNGRLVAEVTFGLMNGLSKI